MINFLLCLSTSLEILYHEELAFIDLMRETGDFYVGDEFHFRFGIFLANKRFVQEQNSINRNYRLSLNQFSFLTNSEYKSLLGGKVSSKNNDDSHLFSPQSKKSSEVTFDWRTKGIINPIRNQGQCGSCWAFSTICCVEARWAQAYNTLLQLSEQMLVDCVDTCYGCMGGYADDAAAFVIENYEGKFMTAADYPYIARASICKFDKTKSVAKTTGFERVKPGSSDALIEAVQTSVCSLLIDASINSFMQYKSGIYDDTKCDPTQ